AGTVGDAADDVGGPGGGALWAGHDRSRGQAKPGKRVTRAGPGGGKAAPPRLHGAFDDGRLLWEQHGVLAVSELLRRRDRGRQDLLYHRELRGRGRAELA